MQSRQEWTCSPIGAGTGRPVHVLATHNAFETQAIGEALAAAIRPGQVIALRGVLGSGKTTFVQGLARGLGVRSRVSGPLLCWSMNTLALMAHAWRT